MKKTLPFSIPFTDLKNSVLGKSYELSLVFIDSKVSRRLNRTYRGKDKSTNVLSFPLSNKSGEVLIDLVTAKKELKTFGMNFKDFVSLLFIHGILHLKGMTHGAKMEGQEKKLLKLLNGKTNRSRN